MPLYLILQAALEGYRLVWRRRRDVLRLAAVPLGFKIASFVIIALLDLGNNFLRQGLVLLPAYFVEGALVALVARLALFQHADLADQTVKRDLTAAAILYTLTKLVSSCLTGLIVTQSLSDMKSAMQQPSADPGAPVFLLSLALLAASVWAFRFFWLYVPVAAGVTPRRFLRRARPFIYSVHIAFFWVACFLPPVSLLLLMLQGIGAVAPTLMIPGSWPQIVLAAIGQAAAELAVMLGSAAGFALWMRALFQGPDRNGFYRL